MDYDRLYHIQHIKRFLKIPFKRKGYYEQMNRGTTLSGYIYEYNFDDVTKYLEYNNADKKFNIPYRNYIIKIIDFDFSCSNKFKNAKVVKLIYLDMVGYFLYFCNKIFFKEEICPSKVKVFLWDKFFSPITIVLDFITNYKYGKNVLCVYKKN